VCPGILSAQAELATAQRGWSARVDEVDVWSADWFAAVGAWCEPECSLECFAKGEFAALAGSCCNLGKRGVAVAEHSRSVCKSGAGCVAQR
jgi:hypothetical protein